MTSYLNTIMYPTQYSTRSLGRWDPLPSYYEGIRLYLCIFKGSSSRGVGIPTDTLLSALIAIAVTVCRYDRPQSGGRSGTDSQQSVSTVHKVAQFTADVVGDGNRLRSLVVDKNDRYFSPEYFFPVYVPVRLSAH